MKHKIKVNETVVNTYSYLKGNYSEDDFIVNSQVDLDFKINNNNSLIDFNPTIKYDLKDLGSKINSGVNEVILDDLSSGKFINIKSDGHGDAIIKSSVKSTSSTTFNIYCKDRESIYIENEVTGDGEQFNHFYYIKANKLSRVKLVIFTSSQSKGFINILGECEEEGAIEVIFVNVNKNNLYTNCEIYLNGKESKSEIITSYICREDFKYDYNLTSAMVGEETECKILGKGVLLDSGKKVFRGTIDFKRGCFNSFGHENEEVIILSKDAKNQSLPLLLCKEKNVKGSHGFTANSIDKDKLFYLLSRGFNEKEAKGLILKGKFLSVLNRIDNEGFINKFIDILMEAI